MSSLTAPVVFSLGLALSCGPALADRLPHLLTLEGFSAPECVVVDPGTGMAYVSNMASPPETYWADTGKGFISRLRSDGTVDALRWVESTDAFVLHQPKGMAIHDGKLYAADNTRVLVISIADARPLATLEVSGAERLNDMATDGKRVYVSDTGTGKILRLDLSGQGQHEIVGRIGGINGITLDQGRLYAVSWTLHEIFEVPLADGPHLPIAFDLDRHFTNLDGIERMPDGSFLVSDFTGNRVAAVSADRRGVKTLFELTTPADIGIDRERQRLYVPQLQSDRVVVLSLAPLTP
jgi:DNA-binding beta-propeller fold protein YncE